VDQISFAPQPPVPVAASFAGDRGEFRRLVVRGTGLELVTVGFYRFWLATDIRRHLWSNTDIGDDAAEYTGNGKELLLGFLFALAILVPIYLAYFLIGLEAERAKAFASIPLFLFFYLFGQFAIYRARRYRLTRTVWRGVRFWMSGSGWAYAARSVLWGIAMILTIGLLLPWREAALERYKMGHSYYGDLEGSFAATGWDLFKRGWWLWLSGMLALVLVGWALAKKVPGAAWLPLLLMVAVPFLYGTFKAVEWRWWLSGIRFGDVRLESALSRTALIGLYWKVIGWLLLLLLSFSGYVFACLTLIASMKQVPMAKLIVPGSFQANIPVIVPLALGYLALILAMNVLMRMYLLRDVWARVISSTTIHHIEAAANVAAMGEPANALGEGFADGLDVAGF
jgi:uncharacterized membrane protein YjgN (DUF898 family)